MKKLFLATAMLCFASSASLASEHSVSVTTGEHSSWTRPDTGCNPATGNWQNAAVTTCMPNASGGNDFIRTKEVEVPCPKETKI